MSEGPLELFRGLPDGSDEPPRAKRNAEAHLDRVEDIRAESTLYERRCGGDENAMAAVLRTAVVRMGDVDLLLAIQGVFREPRRRDLG